MIFLNFVITCSGVVKGWVGWGGGARQPQLCSRPFEKSKSVWKWGGPPRIPSPLATCLPKTMTLATPLITCIYKLAKFTVINIYILLYIKHNVGECVAIYPLHH